MDITIKYKYLTYKHNLSCSVVTVQERRHAAGDGPNVSFGWTCEDTTDITQPLHNRVTQITEENTHVDPVDVSIGW